MNPVRDCEEIRDELLKILFGIWDHIKNHGEHGAEKLYIRLGGECAREKGVFPHHGRLCFGSARYTNWEEFP